MRVPTAWDKCPRPWEHVFSAGKVQDIPGFMLNTNYPKNNQESVQVQSSFQSRKTAPSSPVAT